MRIAFTSCFSAEYFPQQPIWSQIAAANPDVLVLLGDSVYYDVGTNVDMAAIKKMDATRFAAHAHGKFSRQLALPEFQALIQSPSLSTYAIWDDHDFLWNDACGANVLKEPQHKELLYPSRATFAAYREALAQRLAPGSFPPAPPHWSSKTPAPGYSVVALPENVFLHLTDGRSFRKRAALTGKTTAVMGRAQLDAMEAKMVAAPAGAVHLVASGSVFDAYHGETWLDCKSEYDRLKKMAEQHNIVVLSGDDHDAHRKTIQVTGTRRLYEATASGAALYSGVIAGNEQRNYGMLTIDSTYVGIDVYKWGKSQDPKAIDRTTWL